MILDPCCHQLQQQHFDSSEEILGLEQKEDVYENIEDILGLEQEEDIYMMTLKWNQKMMMVMK